MPFGVGGPRLSPRSRLADGLEEALAAGVHANTVYYRLERIAERTGCDVRRVEDLIDLLLAVSIVSGSE